MSALETARGPSERPSVGERAPHLLRTARPTIRHSAVLSRLPTSDICSSRRNVPFSGREAGSDGLKLGLTRHSSCNGRRPLPTEADVHDLDRAGGISGQDSPISTRSYGRPSGNAGISIAARWHRKIEHFARIELNDLTEWYSVCRNEKGSVLDDVQRNLQRRRADHGRGATVPARR